MNDKTRNEQRRKLVETFYMEEISELIKKSGEITWFHGSRGRHPVRKWVDSVRGQLGYGEKTDWRTIWFTILRDYKHIKNNHHGQG